MIHKVLISREAEDQIASISDYIAHDSPQNARRWRVQLRERLRTLRKFSDRHEVAYRADTIGRDVHHTFFGVYRILYAIKDDTVVILSVRHGARQALTPDEVRRLVE